MRAEYGGRTDLMRATRSSRWPPRTLALVVVTIILVACRPPFGLGQADTWSLRVDNSSVGIDYVLRYTSSDAPVYVLAVAGSEGIVRAGSGAPDPLAVLAVLDPLSCRVVSIVDPVPERHSWASFSWGGTLSVGSYDPEDFGDPLDPGQLLAETDRCSESDATATPLPEPSMVAGEWLNGWEMSCQAAGGGTEPFSVRGEFLDGAVEGCEAHSGDIGQGSTDVPDGLSIWNPDGDMRRLGIAWEDTACTNGATVSLYPTMAGYQAHAISIGSKCAPAMKPYAAVFYLTEPIDATMVRGEVERIVE